MSEREVEQLVAQYYYLVGRLARLPPFAQWSWSEDLLQAGRLGLVQAAMSWDRERPFPPFAKACIRNAMRNWIRAECREQRVREDVPDEGLANIRDPAAGEEAILDRLSFRQRVEATFPPNSRERYILLALARGQSKAAVAVALGVSTGTVQRIAERAYEQIKQQGAPE